MQSLRNPVKLLFFTSIFHRNTMANLLYSPLRLGEFLSAISKMGETSPRGFSLMDLPGISSIVGSVFGDA
jgi:hypothetical protein